MPHSDTSPLPVGKQSLILVTGATGAVGPSVVQALSAIGHRVRSLSLKPPPVGLLPNSVEVCVGDVADLSTAIASMEDVDTVIHLAALLHTIAPPPELLARYEHVNVQGTAAVIEAATRTGISRVVLFSTIAVYGRTRGQILNEDSPVFPDTYYSQTKLAAEQLVLDAKRADGQPLGTVLRLGTTYGSRVKGNYRRLVRGLARGRFLPTGSGSNRRTLVYDKDIARAAVLAMQHPAAAGKIYNVTDGQFHTVAEILAAICEALGRTPPRFSIPAGLMRLAAGFSEDISQLAGCRSLISRATIDKYTEDIAVEGQRIQAELGFRPMYDLLAGWRDAIHEMYECGDL